MKDMAFFALILAGVLSLIWFRESGEIETWIKTHEQEAELSGVDPKSLLAPDTNSVATYTFQDEEHSGVFSSANDKIYPPEGVLYVPRSALLKLVWDFNAPVFWASDPTVDLISPANATVVVSNRTRLPPTEVATSLVYRPALTLELSTPGGGVTLVSFALRDLRVAIAERSGSGFTYRFKELESATVRVIVSDQ